MSWIRARWSKISTALLVATALGIGGTAAYARLAGNDCCAPGAACCKPGSPCCHHGKEPVAER